jgi:hypothetical protein
MAPHAKLDCLVASAPRKKLGLGKAAATIKTVVARLDRAIEYAAASRSISNVSGILGRPVKPGDDSGVCFIHQGRPKAGTELAMTTNTTQFNWLN